MNNDLLKAFEEYIKYLRKTGKINTLWDNLDNETKEAVRILITELGKNLNKEVV